MRLSDKMATDGDTLLSELPGLLATNLVLTMVILVPVMIGVGIIVTHRIAGPVYRFETYLGQVARGEDVGSCRLREGDELQELCERINEAVSALRNGSTGGAAEQADPAPGVASRNAA
jgi:nitrogen fixation/metabolism regulation signal transduction histidine kinase